MGAPVRFQKAVPRSKEKRRSGAPKGAPVRVMGRQFPPAGGTGPIARRANGCGVPRPRISALRFPLWECEGFETDNLERQPAGMRRAATLPHGSATHGERNDAPIKEDNHRAAVPGRSEGRHSGARRHSASKTRVNALMAAPRNDRRGFFSNLPKAMTRFGETNPRCRTVSTGISPAVCIELAYSSCHAPHQ